MTEDQPLLGEAGAARQGHGRASFFESMITIGKSCMGMGTLALPFAASEGGLFLSTIGLFLVGCWNLYAIQRLCQCLKYLPDSRRPQPPVGTAMFSRVAWHALGPTGLQLCDLLMVSLLVGVLVAYQDAIVSFLQQTPLTTGSFVLDALITSAIIAMIATVPNMGHLATAAGVGLFVLVAAFIVIAIYGGPPSLSGFHVWPVGGLIGASRWFGCVVFSFGVVPLTYNVHEGMAHPEHLIPAASLAILGVSAMYTLIGCGLLALYPAVTGNIMSQVTVTGIPPTIVRCSFVVVLVLTSPLLLLPCGELLEGKVTAATGVSSNSPYLQAVVRFSVCALSLVISIGVPGFVNVLSFVGCFSTSVVCFILPPCVHLVLAKLSGKRWNQALVFDAIMIAWGFTSTVITTSFTVMKSFGKM